MARRKSSRGTCFFCQRELSKSGMSRHLTSCTERQKAIANREKKSGARQSLYHLQVQDAYALDFWLQLEMNGSKRLEDLDYYLKAIWLECCGHLSQFSFGGWGGEEIDMDTTIAQVFRRGGVLTHIYDFGTSSETLIKPMGAREGKPLTSHPIFLMARNEMPEQFCIECNKSAAWLCIECLIEEDTWGTLCGKHAETHPHREYGEPMPLVNSPRLGMCGYEGPAEPPY